MGHIEKIRGMSRGTSMVMAVVFAAIFLSGGLASPRPGWAATVSCGGCHSIPPVGTDNPLSCDDTVAKSHPAHTVVDDTTTCARCHTTPAGTAPTTLHNNNVNDVLSSVGYSDPTCTKACHDNRPATWGGALDCNMCHYRNGPLGNYTMTGLHVSAGHTMGHFSSIIKVNSQTITCTACHPDNSGESVPLPHIGSTNFTARADMSEAFANVTVVGVGYTKGGTQGTGTCAKSCHYNDPDPFYNYTIFFKPGQKKYFGPYQTKSWADTDLNCNECHSTPGQQATFSSMTSTEPFGNATSAASKNANQRHENHMFNYKLNPYNFSGQDRNIYCDDCHVTPDINATRGFRLHSTTGSGGSGIIELPVKSQNARVYLGWRNNNVGRDGTNPPEYVRGSCNNIYCHTIMVTGKWTEDACNECHGTQDGVGVGTGAPGYRNWTTAATYPAFEDYSGGGGAHYSHVVYRGYPCRTCHYKGGGDGENPAEHNVGGGTVTRANVNVDVHPDFWFNNQTSVYDWATRSCNNVKCHYGSSQNWDCTPLH